VKLAGPIPVAGYGVRNFSSGESEGASLLQRHRQGILSPVFRATAFGETSVREGRRAAQKDRNQQGMLLAQSRFGKGRGI